jgi:Zn-dependent protease with chaperone function
MSMPSEIRMEARARYGDGRTAASSPALIGLERSGDRPGIAIRLEERGIERFWPLTELAVAAPLHGSSNEALLRRAPPKDYDPQAGDIGEDYGATLFIHDRRFVQALIAAAPQLSTTRERWRFARPGLAAALAILLVGGAIWAFDLNPSRTVANLVPQSTWESVGGQMLASVTKGHRECTGRAGRDALDRLMRRLVEGDYRSQGYEAKVVEWSLLNAFAMPGRRLVLTSRLVETATSAEEIAGVLAHEIGHGLERHPEAAIVRILGLATLAKVFASGVGDTFSNASLLLVQLRYNRDGEREADLRAAEILKRAEIDVRPLAGFLNRMKRITGDSGTEPLGGILSTHPGIDERVKAIEAMPKHPSRPAMSEADLAALRAICK